MVATSPARAPSSIPPPYLAPAVLGGPHHRTSTALPRYERRPGLPVAVATGCPRRDTSEVDEEAKDTRAVWG